MTEYNIVRGVKNIFIEFVRRDGYTIKQATEEFRRIDGKTLDGYLTTSRLGASFVLTRAERRNIYMTYENALNHASF